MFWKRKKNEEQEQQSAAEQTKGAKLVQRDGKYCLVFKGQSVLGAEFDKIEKIDECLVVVYREKRPYIINLENGNVYDIFQMQEQDPKTATEKIMNWVLRGLQLLYRDTDEPIDAAHCFKVGDTLRAGYFVDVSPYAGKPMHKYRYIIASAHAARLCVDSELDPLHTLHFNSYFKLIQYCTYNGWPLHTLHFNSYFKVMDVYEEGGVTQIFLLHIPAKAVFSPFLGGVLEINIGGKSLVEIARKSLQTKLAFPPHENLEDKEWLERTSSHIGFDDKGEPFSLMPRLPIMLDENIQQMSNAIRTMGNDTDPINLIMERPAAE